MENIANPQDHLTDIKALIDANDQLKITDLLESLQPVEIARSISRLDKDQQARLIELLGPKKAAAIISVILDFGSTDIVDRLPSNRAAPIVKEMARDQQADMLKKIGEDDAEAILQEIKPTKAQKIRQLMGYPEDTAGALMITEYLAYDLHRQVKDVLDDLRQHGEQYSDYDIQYAYVVADTHKLVGVLRLRDLLMAPRHQRIQEVMVKKPLSVDVHTSLRDLRDFFRQYTFLGVPVVDDLGHLVGVVRSSSVREAANKRNNQLFLKFAGIVGGEEFRSMPLVKRSSRRLSWLSINIVLNIIAASVIALYQDTLEKAIVLAVFLPIISDMSGCSGNQGLSAYES